MRYSSTFIFPVLLCFLMICCLPGLMWAQSEKEDVVYLKDGSVLRGQILENSDDRIKLEMVRDNVLAMDKEEVEKISREEKSAGGHYKSSGYINHTGMGVLPGTESTTARFEIVNGFQIFPRISVGLGIGFVPYNDPLGLIPVFLDTRYRFRKANTTPFVFLRTGYNFSVLADEDRELASHSGGLNLNPGFGLELYTGSGFGWYLTGGLNIDKASFEESLWNNRTLVTDLNFRRFQVGIGLIF